MTKRHIIEIAIRIYALYLLVQIPMSVWGIGSVFLMDYSQLVKDPLLYKAWAIVSPFLYFLISMFLLLKAENISKFIVGRHEIKTESDERFPPYSELSFWITLLGIYFLVTSISSIIAELIRTPIYVRDNYMWSIIIPKSIMIVAAYYMTFKSQKVADFILKNQREIS